MLSFTRRREANAVNEQQAELERQARRWLTRTLSWHAQLQALRVRADLTPAGPPVAEPHRDHLVAVTTSSRPDVTGWNEHLDRSA